MNIFQQLKPCQILRKSNIKKLSTCRILLKQSNQNQLLISCLNGKLNHHKGQVFSKLDNVPLASKGWTHNKSNGDHFTIYPNVEDFDKPNINLEELNIDSKLINVLREEGILLATDLQSEAIPLIQSGKHALIAAETGCGKTLAYLLPIVNNLIDVKSQEFNTPNALILIPNRELAYQIGAVAKVLGDAVGLNVKVLVGGKTKRLMMNPEFSNVDILVCTPGVIGKLSTVGIFKLDKVLYSIFDEADTLLDDSFQDRLPTLANRLGQSQFIFASATLPRKFPVEFEPIMQNLITVKSPRLHRPLLNIKQKFIRLTKSNRPAHLLQIAKANKSPMLVFANKNDTCDWISLFLNEHNIKCVNVRGGGMNYDIRIQQWQKFLKGEVNIVSVTGAGSRGLDTTQVKHVLNYDFPNYASEYIHRVGRVGRLGSVLDSHVTNFISGLGEIKLVQQIEHAIRTNTEIPNVDGNIKALIKKRILQEMRECA